MKLNSICSSLLAAVALHSFALSTQAVAIVNGNFEAGNTGFTSAYQYVAPGGSSLWPEAVYTVDNNPHDSHGLFYSMGDHTSGTGDFMIINGAGTTGIPIWSGTVDSDLTVGELYDFSAWMASVHPASPAVLTFMVDGLPLGTYSPTPNGDWTQQLSSFTATQARPIFEVINSNGQLYGNDFALDDINVSSRSAARGTSVPDGGPGMAGLAAVVGTFVASRLQNRRK